MASPSHVWNVGWVFEDLESFNVTDDVFMILDMENGPMNVGAS